MKLVLIHGPPAAGKLAVARALARLGPFKLFDHHASIDLALRVFAFGSSAFGRIVNGVRELVFEEAARAGVNLIFTYVYAHPEDEPYLEGVMARLEAQGGEICLVHLSAPRDVLLERVGHASRQDTGKLKSAAELAPVLARYDVFTPYPLRESLRLDSSSAPPETLARIIADHFDLAYFDLGHFDPKPLDPERLDPKPSDPEEP